MGAIFVVANHFAADYPWAGYLRAFSEASMVGGLADWFAVTALFRRPLGLPIPHTAIVPNNKDRIADTLGRFLKSNFLVPTVVARRLEHLDLAGAVARRLSQPRGGGKLRESFAIVARQMLGAIDDDQVSAMIRGGVDRRLREFDFGTLLAGGIESAIENRRHGALVDAGLRWISRALNDNEALIRGQVREKTGWFLRATGLDSEIADQIIGALNKLLGELAADPAHPMRIKATEGLVSLAFDLRHDASTRARLEAFRAELLAHPAVTDYLDTLWSSAKSNLLKATDNPGALSEGPVGAMLSRLGTTIDTDPKLRHAINSYARRAIVAGVAGYGDQITLLVSETIRGWDADMVTQKLEGVVGRDLQYIRINGTVIGGLAGLAIYTASHLLS